MNPDQKPTVLFVCTGNAARSVMAAAMLRAATGAVNVEGAGTHSIPGLPMSTRTRTALADLDLADPDHRSCQLDADMAASADLIAIFEPMHLIWIRRELPAASARTASLGRIVGQVAAGPLNTLDSRIAAADFDRHDFEPWEEVIDPAGGEIDDFRAAAKQINGLVQQLLPVLGQDGVSG